MVFNFFAFKKKPVIEDVEAKVPTPAAKPAPMTFDEALAAQAAAEGRVAVSAAPIAATEPVTPADPVAEQITPATEPVTAVVAEQPAAADVSLQRPAAPTEPEPETKAVAIAQPEVPGQMDTMKATREDVIAAYKIFLGRLPESMEMVAPRVGVTPAALLVDFLVSKEFLDQPPKAQLVLALAKKILDARKQAAGAEAAASAAAAPTTQGQPAA